MAGVKPAPRPEPCCGLVADGAGVAACGMRVWKLFLGWLVLAAVAQADQAKELASIHVEVIGGRERIAALKAMRATGYVYAGGKKVRFSQITARPNRVRQEIGSDGRLFVQVSDGTTAPWTSDSRDGVTRTADMPAQDAKLFTADAEFDDPLVAGAERGFSFDFAGEVNANGRKLVRFLVTRKFTDTFALLVDAETFFIVARIEQRHTAGGLKKEIVTRYGDFRPVDGVLLPHRISVLADGKPVQEIVIETIEANPLVTAAVFARTPVSVPLKK